MYICNDPICDPVCDFCWYCVHDENGTPVRCAKGKIDDFSDGCGFCDDFKCRLHEEQPPSIKTIVMSSSKFSAPSWYKKKQRGQKRKLSSLLKNIDSFKAFKCSQKIYEHFHVPCSLEFIESPKTSEKVRTIFCQKWIETTEQLIKQKPSELSFCKVVSLLSVPNYWSSQIIIFYDEEYYNTFWDRKTSEQLWEKITDKNLSFVHEKGIKTSLKEIGYIETMEEDDYICKSVLWFYGEL